MRKSCKRLRTIALTLACGMVAVGCDDARQADNRVREAIHESRLARLNSDDAKAQTLLQQASNEAEAAAASKALAKSLLARAEMDAAAARSADNEAGINRGNREIARILWEIRQLAQQIRASNNLVNSYQAFEPKDARVAAEKQVQDASGPAGQPWVGEPPAAIPTLATAQQRLSELEAAIRQKQEQIQALQNQQQQQSQQAQQFAQQAASKSPREGFPEFKQASDLRKAASMTAIEIDKQQSELAKLQHDYALAETQRQAVANAVEQFRKMIAQIEQGWKGIQEQVVNQQQLASTIVEGGPTVSEPISKKAEELQAQNAQMREAYDEAQKNLESAIGNFEQAATAANELSNDMRKGMGELPSDNQLRISMETMRDVYNPAIFKLGQANATLALADLLAGRAQTLSERVAVMNQLGEVLAAAKLTMPEELNDAGLADEAKTIAQQADQRYEEAATLYEEVGGGPSLSETHRNAARSGRIYALYGRSLLGRATGDANAATYLAAAREQRDQVIQEGKGGLVALPAELVASPTTAPTGTTPAPAPRTPAPAPAAPTETAPAEPTEAPAPAAPEGAAPAPAEGAAPPEGAAPAPPAETPPVEGTDAPAPTPPPQP